MEKATTTLYLIRHSIKEKNYGIVRNSDSAQIKNEKMILSCEGEKQALLLSQNEELQNLDEVWTSNNELKNIDGESGMEVQNRIDSKITDIINQNKDKRIAIVCHNACILFYLLKYCKLENAELNKRLTISFNNKVLIKDGNMKAPSIMKLEFDDNKLVGINYIEI